MGFIDPPASLKTEGCVRLVDRSGRTRDDGDGLAIRREVGEGRAANRKTIYLRGGPVEHGRDVVAVVFTDRPRRRWGAGDHTGRTTDGEPADGSLRVHQMELLRAT